MNEKNLPITFQVRVIFFSLGRQIWITVAKHESTQDLKFHMDHPNKGCSLASALLGITQCVNHETHHNPYL